MSLLTSKFDCPFENHRETSNFSMNSTNSDVRSIITQGALKMAEIPLGSSPSTTIDSSPCSERTQEIEARNNDIKRLEKSIKELHDLFMRMLTLTEEQVIKIHNIGQYSLYFVLG